MQQASAAAKLEAKCAAEVQVRHAVEERLDTARAEMQVSESDRRLGRQPHWIQSITVACSISSLPAFIFVAVQAQRAANAAQEKEMQKLRSQEHGAALRLKREATRVHQTQDRLDAASNMNQVILECWLALISG